MVRNEEFTHINACLNSVDSASFASTLALALIAQHNEKIELPIV
jgi:hypothetical protein